MFKDAKNSDTKPINKNSNMILEFTQSSKKLSKEDDQMTIPNELLADLEVTQDNILLAHKNIRNLENTRMEATQSAVFTERSLTFLEENLEEFS